MKLSLPLIAFTILAATTPTLRADMADVQDGMTTGKTSPTGDAVRYNRTNKEDAVDPAQRGQTIEGRQGNAVDNRSGFGVGRYGDARPAGSVGAAATQPPAASGSTSGTGVTGNGNVAGTGSTAGNAGSPGASGGGGMGSISNSGTHGINGSGF